MITKYQKLYNKFIATRALRKKVRNQGLETHHILPKSLGGTDAKSNLVVLTAKEHWFAHRLLYKMTTGQDRSKMAYALIKMGHKHSRKYQHIKHINSLTTQKQWQDPKYRAKQMAYRHSEQRRAISRATMLRNRSQGKIMPKRGKVNPAVRLEQLQAKYGSNPTRSQRYYLKQVAKQI